MSYILISRDNLFWNLNQIVAQAQSMDKIALVLKDNAYGHGLEIVAAMAAEAGVRHAVVRTLEEAKRAASFFETVLVLADMPDAVPEGNIRFTLNDMGQIDRYPEGCAVELKFDTGMHRNGIPDEMAEEAVAKVRERGLKIVGVMTHHRSADEMGSHFFWQKRRFEELKRKLKREGLEGVRWHSCNSAALFRTQNFDEDIARVGIAVYGCLRMPEPFKSPQLRPVMSLWAERISSRRVTPDMGIGYGGEGRLATEGIVSAYDIGYGDGWLRGDAAHPYRLPDGRSIVGRVSMDLISVEGTDEAICLFDDAAEAARQFGTIAYDVMVKLHPRIKRRVV